MNGMMKKVFSTGQSSASKQVKDFHIFVCLWFQLKFVFFFNYFLLFCDVAFASKKKWFKAKGNEMNPMESDCFTNCVCCNARPPKISFFQCLFILYACNGNQLIFAFNSV